MACNRGLFDRFAGRRLAASLLAGTLWSACTLAGAVQTVVIAAEDDWAPYSAAQPGQADPAGFAVDMVREVFKTQGIDVKFQTVPFPRCMYLARIGAVAGCFNATIVDGNRDLYTWHTTPMFEEDLAIFGPAASQRTNLRLQDLEDKRVGYTVGYTYPSDFYNHPRIDRRGVRSDGLQMQMLVAGRLDYVLLNTMPAYLRINKDPQLKGRLKKVGLISSDGFWVAFSKARVDSRQLAELFERGLLELKASGRYKTMQEALRQSLAP